MESGFADIGTGYMNIVCKDSVADNVCVSVNEIFACISKWLLLLLAFTIFSKKRQNFNVVLYFICKTCALITTVKK